MIWSLPQSRCHIRCHDATCRYGAVNAEKGLVEARRVLACGYSQGVRLLQCIVEGGEGPRICPASRCLQHRRLHLQDIQKSSWMTPPGTGCTRLILSCPRPLYGHALRYAEG